jgi:hypothetical protein
MKHLSREQVLDLVATWSYVATNPDHDRILRECGRLLDVSQPQAAAGRGDVPLPYRCVTVRITPTTTHRP